MLPTETLALARLITECATDPSLGSILADLLEEGSHALALKIREHVTLPLLWEAARFAGTAGCGVRRQCKRIEQEYAQVVRGGRAAQITGTEYVPEMRRFPVGMPTLREAEGSLRYQRWCWKTTGPQRMRSLRSLAHCQRLVRRCLEGHDVPIDVQRHACHFVCRIQLCLSTLVEDWPSGGSGNDVVLTSQDEGGV